MFAHTEGVVVDVPIDDFPAAKKSFLPPMPKSRPRFGDVVAEANKNVAQRKPWVRGLYEGVIAADLISKQNLEQANRISLIVLDSTLEIAFKEFLVKESGHYYSDANLSKIFASRHNVQTEVQKYVKIDATIWKKISHYSDMRNKLIHQRATAGVSRNDLADFRSVVEHVLKKLYKLKFRA